MRMLKFIVALTVLQGLAAYSFAIDVGPGSSWVKYVQTVRTPPVPAQGSVSTTTRDSISVIRFPCDYASLSDAGTYERCYWDRAYSGVSLSSANAIKIKMYVDNPAPVATFTLFIELGVNLQWYGASQPVKAGWQELVFRIPDMTAAGAYSLTSLATLSKIRLSPIRRAGSLGSIPTATNFDVASIEAVNIPVVVLGSDSGDVNATTTAMLDRYGIEYFLLGKTYLTTNASNSLHRLHGTSIVIANNVDLSAAQANLVSDYFVANSAARFIGFGPQALFESSLTAAKGQLANTLGITLPGGSSVANVTGFAFTGTGITGASLALPETLSTYSEETAYAAHYTSTGATTATTAFANWMSNGVATSTPAMHSNNVAIYVDKYWLPDYNPAQGDQMLLAFMMKLQPALVSYIYGKVDTAGFAGFGSFAAAVADISSKVATFPEGERKTDALGKIADAEALYGEAELAGISSPYVAVKKFIDARRLLAEVFAQTKRPGDPGEVRAFWSHSGLGAYPNDWAATLDPAVAAGFTHIISNVARGANVVFNSTHACPGSTSPTASPLNLCFEKDKTWQTSAAASTNPLTEGITAAHNRGLKFIAWKNDFAWGYSSVHRAFWEGSDFVQKKYNNETIAAPTPCSADMRDMDFDVIDEIATNYAVDGIQLDFIRFQEDGSFDTHCRAGFATYLTGNTALLDACKLKSGDPVADWRAKASSLSSTSDAACVSAFQSFKKSLITAHVTRIRNRIDAINGLHISGKPVIELSAAVYPVGSDAVGQDWPAWITSGSGSLLDRIFAMTYAHSLASFQAIADSATDQALNSAGTGTRKPLHFGIDGRMTSSEGWVAQLDWLRNEYRFPSPGFSFFNLTRDAIENMLPQIKYAIDYREHGLTASYFNDTDTNSSGAINERDDKLVAPAALRRIDPNVDLNLASLVSPGSGVNADYFSARWTGLLVVPAYTGTYEFCLKGDDGVRLWINDVDLFGDDNWTAQDSVTRCESIALTAGRKVPIKVEFFDLTEEGIAQLTWSWPGHAAQVVPTSSLYAE